MNFSTKNSLTTLAQTFIMGSIDAYTFQNFHGSFVSAQTGNLVVFAYEWATKGWHTAYIRVPVLLGFLLGAFISQACKHIKLDTDRRFNVFLLFSILFLGLLGLSTLNHLSMLTMLFCLGLFSGYELTVFNKIGSTSVNNGIMTGNLKNFSNNVYEGIFSHDRTAMIKAGRFLSGILMFILGIVFSAYVLHAAGDKVFAAAIIINVVLLAIIYIDFKRTHHQPTIN
ncbi:hypothetical protein FAM21834_01203 [Lentilactobacillus parabuchneri]|jgi:uncharacterized membrane protein YoaK (UPF0700 family)|nr:YoaK family protein [Lentilactobacillus parabuchneri]APR07337.1 hypothetical protein FAM21731_01145 [Lentilactobacillus parabuchneri]MBW0223069.1 DUF1275 domain-containing protein [Lentilactobacillus parabuchneri]MBW0245378.1 DUF1275 domain-containing protein [Lentilactobacillus parabuchneri]MBW0263905.1 DUF1275 domain-containing protein [Lentilactobacillus parabuchneri]MCT2884534.1 DUF1275 domain-containing protein [Lentilactobacillus parabuchneri]